MRAAKHRPPPLTNRARRYTWTGGCFSLAAKVMLDAIKAGHWEWLEHARLCHGEVRDSYHACRWIEHAWVECPAVATMDDGSTQPVTVVVDESQPDPKARIIPAELFLQHTAARNVHRYDARAMMRLALEHDSDGPWT